MAFFAPGIPRAHVQGSKLALLGMRGWLQLPAPLADDGLAQRPLGGAASNEVLR